MPAKAVIEQITNRNQIPLSDIVALIDALIDDVGYEGATSLADKLTAARAALLDRLSIIAAGGAGELTPGRATNLDNLDAAVSSRAVPGDQMSLTAAALLLIQALVLSDATPFAGANIDAAISSRAAPGAAMDLVAGAVTSIRDSVMAATDVAVYYDSVNGSAGTAWPIGTVNSPVDNYDDMVTIAAARKLNTVVMVHGVMTLTGDLTGYHFIGNGFQDFDWDLDDNLIELGGHVLTRCSFDRINIYNTAGGELHNCGPFVECSLIFADVIYDSHCFESCLDIETPLLDSSQLFRNCFMYADEMDGCFYFTDCHVFTDLLDTSGDMLGGFLYADEMDSPTLISNIVWLRSDTITGGVQSRLTGCQELIGLLGGAVSIDTPGYNMLNGIGKIDATVDLTAVSSPNNMKIESGTLELTNLTAGVVNLTGGPGLIVTVAASCTGGTLNIYGPCQVIDNSAGTTVNVTDVTPVTQTTGTFSYDETNAGEQTALTLAITARANIGGVWLDFVNVTQDTTIRVKHQIDGTNYRTFEVDEWEVATDDDGILITGFTAYRNVQVSFQCGGGGGGSVNVPYAVV